MKSRDANLIIASALLLTIGLIWCTFSNRPNKNSLNSTMQTNAALKQKLKTPVKVVNNSPFYNGTFNLNDEQKKLDSTLTALLTKSFGGYKSVDDLLKDRNIFKKALGKKASIALFNTLIVEQDGNRYQLIAQKNNGVTVTFGKIDISSLTQKVSVVVKYDLTNSSGNPNADIVQGIDLITFKYNYQTHKVTSFRQVPTRIIGDVSNE